MWCDKFYGNYNAESKVKKCKLPQSPEERNRWITIIPRNNIVRDTD